jgi:transcriptional regulator with XRE-family HTH domain
LYNGRRAAGLNGRRAAGLNGRRAAGLNVDTCADSCGLSRSFLHMVEQGRRAPALAQMLAIADAYQVERREAAWAWILQSAPDVAIYLISYETVEGNTMLQRHFSDQYEGQVRAREEARKAANAARRAEQNLRAAEKRAEQQAVEEARKAENAARRAEQNLRAAEKRAEQQAVEEARKAENAARRAEQNLWAAEKRAEQNLRAAEKRAQVDSDIVGGPSPAGPDFDHVGVRMVDPRETQEEHPLPTQPSDLNLKSSAKSPNSVRRGKEICRTPE